MKCNAVDSCSFCGGIITKKVIQSVNEGAEQSEERICNKQIKTLE